MLHLFYPFCFLMFLNLISTLRWKIISQKRNPLIMSHINSVNHNLLSKINITFEWRTNSTCVPTHRPGQKTEFFRKFLQYYRKTRNILYDIKARPRDPFGLLYRLDKCFSYCLIHKTLHPGKIYPVKNFF